MFIATQLAGFGAAGGNGGIDSFTKLMLHFDGADGATTTTDSSASGHTVTFLNGAVLDDAQAKFGSTSLLCGDGVDDYVRVPDSADWAFGTGDFTIDFWIKRPSVSGAFENVFGQGDSGLTSGYHYGRITDSNNFHCAFNDEGINVNSAAGGALNNTNWNHIAVVRNGSNFAIAINGSWGSNTSSGSSLTDSGGVFAFGQTGDFTGGGSFNGWIDEARISKGVARWAPGVSFTPPTEPYSL
jgi:hypothetical protein